MDEIKSTPSKCLVKTLVIFLQGFPFSAGEPLALIQPARGNPGRGARESLHQRVQAHRPRAPCQGNPKSLLPKGTAQCSCLRGPPFRKDACVARCLRLTHTPVGH